MRRKISGDPRGDSRDGARGDVRAPGNRIRRRRRRGDRDSRRRSDCISNARSWGATRKAFMPMNTKGKNLTARKPVAWRETPAASGGLHYGYSYDYVKRIQRALRAGEGKEKTPTATAGGSGTRARPFVDTPPSRAHAKSVARPHCHADLVELLHGRELRLELLQAPGGADAQSEVLHADAGAGTTPVARRGESAERAEALAETAAGLSVASEPPRGAQRSARLRCRVTDSPVWHVPRESSFPCRSL